MHALQYAHCKQDIFWLQMVLQPKKLARRSKIQNGGMPTEDTLAAFEYHRNSKTCYIVGKVSLQDVVTTTICRNRKKKTTRAYEVQSKITDGFQLNYNSKDPSAMESSEISDTN